MCGITGFLTLEAPSGAESILRRMRDSLYHRGPDSAGLHIDTPAYLGFRRLSIIDLTGGSQPMANEDGSCWIVYNGEIFNHASLRPDLERAGHVYASHCDTETILHSWEQHGERCVEAFRGMFAFAVWDARRKTLFCARDRLGIKPFYYWWDGRTFAFASEIKALLEHPAIAARFDSTAIGEYLAFGYMSGETTMFQGIRKLMPGHWLKLEVADRALRMRIERYWDPPCCTSGESEDSSRTDEDWIRECRARLEETVRMRLMSDVPLGMFLSGGVDSSAIAALLKREAPDQAKTFAVGYGESAYSELGYARQVADYLKTDHHEVLVSRQDFFGALPGLVWHEDEPIAWPSSVSLYFVARLAREKVTVVLTGEGSDELFAGYGRYRFYDVNQKWLRWYKLLPGALRKGIRNQIAEAPWLGGSLRRKLGHTFLGRGEDLESLYLDNFYSAFSATEQSKMGCGAGHVYDNFERYWREDAPPLSRMLYADQKTYLVELLMKQDQMSMACSLESRVPFLDHPLVEFAARVPDRLKIRDGEAKYIFKRAVENLLPHDIVYRKKMGFPTPLRSWLGDSEAAPLLDSLLSDDGIVGDMLDRKELSSLLDRHRAGTEDATDRIWRLLNLQIWGEIFITGKRSRPWEALEGTAARS